MQNHLKSFVFEILFIGEHNPHIICLNETKINDEISDEFLRIDGFQNIIPKDRTRYGGGVAVYVKNGIKFSERSDLDSDLESVSIELKINYSKPFIVTTIYKPESKDEIYEKIESLICKIDTEDRECILTGDMDCNMLNPQDNNTRHIKRIYNTYEFKQIIKEATRTTSDTKSLIDHIATNRPERIASSEVVPCGISDHDVVYAVRTMRIPRVRGISKMVTVRKFKNFDLPAFRSELSKLNFDRIEIITSNPNEMWLLWRTFVLDVLNKHAPIGNIKIKDNNLPYIAAEVRQLARQRDFLRKKANKTGSKYLKQAFQQMKNRVTYKLRSLKFEYYSKKISENQGDMKSTWKILRKAMNKEAKQSDIETIFVDNEEINDKQEIS